jgi:hypothetical protein
MSEIQNNDGPNPAGNQSYGQEQQNEQPPGVSFKGEKTDLRFEPSAFYKKTWINKPVRTKIGNQTVEFGAKQVRQVQKDLELLNENPAAVQRASALFPAFQSYAREKGVKNPDSLALALEHYAATNEFVKNAELEDMEN